MPRGYGRFACLLVLPLGAFAACGPASAGAGVDGGGAICQPSDTSRCDGQVFSRCVGGHWQARGCGTGVCDPDSGCLACRPGTRYCTDQDVYECSADGAGGTFVETCPDLSLCDLGSCVSACDAVSRSNVGCEFWAVDLPNEYNCWSTNGGQTCNMPGLSGYSCAACQQFSVVVTNTSGFVVHVKVEQNNAPPGEPLDLQVVEEQDVGPLLLQIFNLPMREVDCTEWAVDSTGKLRRLNDTSTCLSSRAYRVTSNYPVVAYQFNPIENAFSNGASLLIPTSGLDADYWVLGWTVTNAVAVSPPGNVWEGIPDFASLTVVGVFPGTQVEVTPAHQTQASPDSAIPAANAGDTLQLTLGPFDVLNLASWQDGQHPTGDLTGSRVTATQPVAVFFSTQRSEAPDNTETYNPPAPPPPMDDQGRYQRCCTEHFEQQMFPISSLGTKFVVTRSPIRSTSGTAEPDFYRILASKPGTVVTTNNPDFPTLTITQPGAYARMWSRDDFIVTANEPIMIAQYVVGQDYLDGQYTVGGDPEFVLFPPQEQHRKEYVFLTPNTFDEDWAIIAAPESTEVLLDGSDVGEEFSPVCTRFPAGVLDGKGYVAIRCKVEDGPHLVQAAQEVGITVYGYYGVGSYGYPGGANVKQINIQ
jgi:hypothetical protein